MTADLAAFLLARIAHDEAAAREQLELRAERYPDETDEPGPDYQVDRGWWLLADPARVLAECDARRRIVALASWEGSKDSLRDRLFGPAADEAFRQGIAAAMRALALPYADHPDYRQEWRP